MNTQIKAILGILVAAVIGLAITVGVMAAGDDEYDGNTTTPNHMMGKDSGYVGMMGAMGSMDSDDMLTHMRQVLGEDGYQRMLAHLADHQSGAPMTGNTTVDQMMHAMMDGMMGQMPMGGGTLPLPGNNAHHETPTPATTPTP